jgi:hypothetical protein
VFSERPEPISELVKGNPEKPLREPALALFACLLNLYQLFQLVKQLAELPASTAPLDPYSGMNWYYAYLSGILQGLFGFTVAFTGFLAGGVLVLYFFNRRVGGGMILVISVLALFVGFMGMSTVAIGFNFFSLIIYFLSPVFGILAGFYGIRGEKPASREAVQEII